MSAWTPGPWDAGSRIIEVGGADFTPIDAAERSVAFVPAALAADASLIAAAPDLYEALVLATAYLSDLPHESAHKIASAIAKARGEPA